MPKLKRKTSHVADRTGFEIYDGPEPRPGMYPAVIKQCKITKSDAGNMMYNIVTELDTEGVEGKEQYNGWPGFPRIVMTDKEGNIVREKAFYRAVCGNEDPEIVYNDLKASEGAGKVTKIGGINPIGISCRVQVKAETYEGERRMVVDTVYPSADGAKKAAKKKEEAAEDDLLVPDDNEAEAEVDYHDMDLVDLKAFAAEHLTKVPRAKAAIISALEDYFEAQQEEEEEDNSISRDELEDMKLKELKAFALEAGIKEKKLKGLSKDEIIDELVDLGIVKDTPPF